MRRARLLIVGRPAEAVQVTPVRHIPQLDGLRLFAFIGGFVAHGTHAVVGLPTGDPVSWSIWWGRGFLLGGGFGVDMFFVLSSYLITTILIREIDATGRINLPTFWMRRTLRIWPLYFAFLFAYTAAGGLPALTFGAFSIFSGNWAIGVWGANTGLANPLWSVSVEEQFYLGWPFLLSILPRRFLRLTSAVLIVFAIVARYVLFSNGYGLTAVWMNTLSHLDAIGIGALIALTPRIHLAPAIRSIVGAVALVAVVTCASTVWFVLMDPTTVTIRAGRAGFATLLYLSASLACGGLLLATLSGSVLLSRPPIVYLGRISYGLYVFHMTALWTVADLSWYWRLPAAFALSVAFAAISYRYYERLFLRLKTRYPTARSAERAAYPAGANT